MSLQVDARGVLQVDARGVLQVDARGVLQVDAGAGGRLGGHRRRVGVGMRLGPGGVLQVDARAVDVGHRLHVEYPRVRVRAGVSFRSGSSTALGSGAGVSSGLGGGGSGTDPAARDPAAPVPPRRSGVGALDVALRAAALRAGGGGLRDGGGALRAPAGRGLERAGRRAEDVGGGCSSSGSGGVPCGSLTACRAYPVAAAAWHSGVRPHLAAVDE